MLAQRSAEHAMVPLGKIRAQTMTFVAYVPFSFVVGNQTLPPGVYQVQRLMGRPAEVDEVGMIVVRSIESRVYKAVVTNLAWHPPAPGSRAQLVFARRAGHHYLSELRIAGEKGHEVPNVVPESELVEFDLIDCEATGA
jgi:hypothetical protein